MKLHHLALLTPRPAALAAFYQDLLSLPVLRQQEDSEGVRAIWLDLDGVIWMIERGPPPGPAWQGLSQPGEGGWQGVLFHVEPGTGDFWERRLVLASAPILGKTTFSLYSIDIDGNRFGVSSYPAPLFSTPTTQG